MYYGKKDIDLSAARNDEEFKVNTDNISVEYCDATAAVYARLGDRRAPQIDLRKISEIRLTGHEQKIYLTHSAQSGKTLSLLLGGEALFKPNFTNYQLAIISDNTALTALEAQTPLRATAASDAAFRVTTTATTYKRTIIQALTNAAVMGDATAQYIEITAGTSIILDYSINPAQLYFKNKTAGSNTVINVMGWA